ncbi:hypothetical protein AAMO2058_000185100 [Amorphochlora amoebiformis]
MLRPAHLCKNLLRIECKCAASAFKAARRISVLVPARVVRPQNLHSTRNCARDMSSGPRMGKEELLSQFQSARTPQVRERVFGALVSQEKKLDTAEYTLMLYTAQAKEEPQLAVRVFEEAMKNVKPSSMILNSGISALGMVGRPQEALDAFEAFESYAPRDLNTYINTIVALSTSRELQHAHKALEILTDIEARGLTPEIEAYHGALQACKTHALWKEAIAILSEMEDNGIEIDTTAMSLSLSSCAHGKKENGKSAAAALMFSSMESKGLVQDEAAYEPLILSLELEGSDEAEMRAFDYFNEMQKRGLVWTVPIYNCMMRLLAKMRLFDAGQDLFVKMETTGLKPDSGTYSAFFQCCKRRGEFDKVEEALEEAKEAGIEVSADMLESYIESAAVNQRKNKALEMLNQVQSEYGRRPKMSSYIHCLKACGYEKDWQSASDLYKQILTSNAEGSDITVDFFNEAIYALGRGGQIELAESILEDMKKRNVDTNVDTYNNLIIASGEVREKEKERKKREKQRKERKRKKGEKEKERRKRKERKKGEKEKERRERERKERKRKKGREKREKKG